MTAGLYDGAGMTGLVIVELFDASGALKARRVGRNLITDAGDLYYATRGIAAVVPSATADATKVTGMKLGTGTTAVAKNGAGAALVTYTASGTANKAFDSTYPNLVNLGAGLGVNAVYKTTWTAGQFTNAAITEAVIVNDAGTDLTSSAANTIARLVFTAVNKTASDSLAITWNHKLLGV